MASKQEQAKVRPTGHDLRDSSSTPVPQRVAIDHNSTTTAGTWRASATPPDCALPPWAILVGGTVCMRRHVLLTMLSSLFDTALQPGGNVYLAGDLDGNEALVLQLVHELTALQVDITLMPEALHPEPRSQRWRLQQVPGKEQGIRALHKIGTQESEGTLISSGATL